jgi:hypothetical protein
MLGLGLGFGARTLVENSRVLLDLSFWHLVSPCAKGGGGRKLE